MDECNPIINIFYRIALMQILCVLLARPKKSTHKILGANSPGLLRSLALSSVSFFLMLKD